MLTLDKISRLPLVKPATPVQHTTTRQAYNLFLTLVYDREVDYCDAQCRVCTKYPSVDFSEIESMYDDSMVKCIIDSNWSI